MGAPSTLGGLTASCAVFAWSLRPERAWRLIGLSLVSALAILACFAGSIVSAFSSSAACAFERVAFTAAFV